MKALLLSAYAAASHRYWARSLIEHLSEIDWTLLELAPRHFQWRMRANPLLWSAYSHETLSRHFDLVVATSMVDLATLIGLYPHLGRAYRVVYFHENQFAYPIGSDQTFRPEPLMVNLYSALAADQVLFNSAWNRDSFLSGARGFLARMPDRLSPDALDRMAGDSAILPVPLEGAAARPAETRPARLIWNHRWEYDKNPEDFFTACRALAAEGIDFELVIMGQQFRRSPAVFEQAREEFASFIVCWGSQSRPEYLRQLSEGGIVVSTALHEFQGLAVMEAVQHGCLPLVPDRLCFPECYAPQYRYDGSIKALTEQLTQWLTVPTCRPIPPDISPWHWDELLPAYRDALLTRA
ncbi:tRNA-queuosine alpha-mannosyltransferase domain-containing protein [Kushneria phosphatilytica]|uniref:tRNA-queuosine alpha-mannosyltransferase n=1 Tax=Kushneria phosphatilytica TaxID=657387 RepID=A0A1S1NXD9_9GAMM|nr:DUF3524 domain-containing protein [Kushneria phosphatilytica]OHV12097.1 glycosyl transferase family 1 [Kushneria phosphatilytica]QEL11293.1 DUF3524 domain-containing protein [Kushneria phosphatilytica]